MTYLNAKKYINSAPAAERESNANMLSILDALGNPHKRIKYLRLAGSNGKTVCAEMLNSVMSCAEYRVGYLRMPLRSEPRENISIEKNCLSMDEFSELTARVRATAAELDIIPTKEEILLAIALLAFHQNNCDLYVIESDHFGADPSKCLQSPFAAVICGTIPNDDNGEISRIRSYITGGIVEIVSAPQNNAAHKIIQETCRAINCRLSIPSRLEIKFGRMSFVSTEFSYKKKDYKLGLCGKFQVHNAVLVLEVIDMLRRKGYTIPDSAVAQGFSSLKIPAKFEVLSISPLIIVDSTHTRVAITSVCEAFDDLGDAIGNSIRLCLPSTDIVHDYVETLSAKGFNVEKVIIPDTGYTPDVPVDTVVCKTVKTLTKSALENLDSNTVLLISGDYSFVSPIRYQILNTLYF